MVLFPQVFQQAGLLLPLLILTLLTLSSALSSFLLVSAMSMMPGNDRFKHKVEYSGVMRHYLSRPFFFLAFAFYQLSLLTTNISLIVQSVQVMDFAIAAAAGRSCLLPQVAPHFAFTCPPAVDYSAGGDTVFGDGVLGLPLGFFLTALAVVPLACFDLDDNMIVQKGAFISLVSIVAVWAVLFVRHGLDLSFVPLVGSSSGGFSSVVGVSIFNFAFLTSIPSWVNSKSHSTSIRSPIWSALGISCCLFVVAGLLCALSFTPWTDSSTLLDKVYSFPTSFTPLARLSFYVFPIVANLTSIPVNSIFQRLNLVEQGYPPLVSTVVAVALPWLVAVFLYAGSGYDELVTWSGVCITSVVNFIIPPTVYIIARRRWQRECREERERLERARQAGGEEVLAGRVLTEWEAEAEEKRDEQRGVAVGSVQYGGVLGNIKVAIAGVPRTPSTVDVVDSGMEQPVEGFDKRMWGVLPSQYARWELPLSAAVLLLMSALCGLTFVVNVQQAVAG